MADGPRIAGLRRYLNSLTAELVEYETKLREKIEAVLRSGGPRPSPRHARALIKLSYTMTAGAAYVQAMAASSKPYAQQTIALSVVDGYIDEEQAEELTEEFIDIYIPHTVTRAQKLQSQILDVMEEFFDRGPLEFDIEMFRKNPR